MSAGDLDDDAPSNVAPTRLDHDEQQAELAQLVPGFAGVVQRSDGEMVIALVPSQARRSTTAEARLVDAVGPTYRTIGARFDFTRLLAAKNAATALMAQDGSPIHEVDIDEATNSVTLSIVPGLGAAQRAALESQLIGADRDRTIYRLIELPFSEPTAEVGFARPAAGGHRIEITRPANDGGTITEYCTMGLAVTFIANATGAKESGFLTNGHCAWHREGLVNREVRQGGVRIGAVKYFGAAQSGQSCPGGVGRCKDADVMFVKADTKNDLSFGMIVNYPLGSNDLGPPTYEAAVQSFLSTPKLGAPMKLSGAFSGGTYGLAGRLCVNTKLNTTLYPGYDFVFKCQNQVDFVPTSQTPEFCRGGDSGGPVFNNDSGPLIMHGIVMSVNKPGKYCTYSPWKNILADFSATFTISKNAP